MGLPQRKKCRLQEYDYSTPGVYFVTICTHERRTYFGTITEGDIFSAPRMELSRMGKIVWEELQQIESHYQNVKVDKYTIMPNHVHLLIRITERKRPFPTERKFDISNVVGKFKAAVTRSVGKAFMPSAKAQIWQRSFHDHVVRGEQDYKEIWEYLENNPAKWKEDRFYTESRL